MYKRQDLCNLVVSLLVKFDACATKIVRVIKFLSGPGFFKKRRCQFSPHGCHFDDIDSKLRFMSKKYPSILHSRFCEV